MKRRRFLYWLGVGGLAASTMDGCYWPDEGFVNQCPAGGVPESLLNHALVEAAWEGIDPRDVWDSHVHLVGRGDGDTGAWLNPRMKSLWHPIQYLQYRFYLNAACVNPQSDSLDHDYIERMRELLKGFGVGPKLMLLAFDFGFSKDGRRLVDKSAFYIPNHFAQAVAARYPEHFRWIASIHPYREDAIEALEWAVRKDTKAIKWLPPVMGIDPTSPRCDEFYDALVRLQVPLLTHAGSELAVSGLGKAAYGNPLRLRRALDRGVRVIVAHCASLGSSRDIDRGGRGLVRSNFELFARLMDDKHYEHLVAGDISSLIQINRLGAPLEVVIQREDWHHRLLNGSDYPLLGVAPLISMRAMISKGYLNHRQADILSQIRAYNPLLFDFICKRTLQHGNQRLSPVIFETRLHFMSNEKDLHS